MTTLGKILIVDDDHEMRTLLEKQLKIRGYDATTSESGEDALRQLTTRSVDVILTDLQMTGLGGLELCRRTLAIAGNIPVIVMTGFGTMESAIDAIRAGAWDYVTKPLELDGLLLVVDRALKHRRLLQEVAALRDAPAEDAGILGQSAVIRRVHELVERVADSDASESVASSPTRPLPPPALRAAPASPRTARRNRAGRR